MSYPPKWKEFCQWRRDNESEDQKIKALSKTVSFAELGRFAARYRLASAFERLEVNGYPSATEDAYSAVLKAFLAYSTLEQLHKAIECDQHLIERWANLAEEPAARLRRAGKILDFLESTMRSQQLRENLDNFRNKETDNCLIVATALRHAVAHGFMTVHPKGTAPQTSERFCESLRQMLLRIADQEFSGLVTLLTQQA
ncbi:MAG: hypothetical protein MJA27_33740 [Pseudanabaenales cyanobacterium]|nr:hypothetical protein [Pseudanabaenales cyanobacterium]